MNRKDDVNKAHVKLAWRRRTGAACRQRGASLLEAISYLGIAAVVVIGAIALLSTAFGSANTNAVSEQVSAIQSGVKKLYSGQAANYSGLTTTVLASAGVFPSTLAFASATGTITNTWDGTVSVTGGTTTFTIEFTQVPQSVCVNALSAGGGWDSITVNSTALALPVTPADASTACTAAAGGNTIDWTST